jgi:hypothetical protein
VCSKCIARGHYAAEKIIATDKETAKVVWETSSSDTPDMTFMAAPLAIEDKIIVAGLGAICPKTSNTNYSSTLSPLKMTRRESNSPFSCMRYTFARLMGSRHPPTPEPDSLGR